MNTDREQLRTNSTNAQSQSGGEEPQAILRSIARQCPSALHDGFVLQMQLARLMPEHTLERNILLLAHAIGAVAYLRSEPDSDQAIEKIAQELMLKHGLSQTAAYYAARCWGFALLSSDLVRPPTVTTSPRRSAPAWSYLSFGHYPQVPSLPEVGQSGSDMTEEEKAIWPSQPIEWLVLKVSEAQEALLISRYGLASCFYHDEPKAVTWGECTLRGWLNEKFYHQAFSPEEQRRILPTALDNLLPGREPYGQPTEDKLFIVNSEEAERYLRERRMKQTIPTPFAVRQGAWSEGAGEQAVGWSPLRCPGQGPDTVSRIDSNGSIQGSGLKVNAKGSCVRPMLRITMPPLTEGARTSLLAYANQPWTGKRVF